MNLPPLARKVLDDGVTARAVPQTQSIDKKKAPHWGSFGSRIPQFSFLRAAKARFWSLGIPDSNNEAISVKAFINQRMVLFPFGRPPHVVACPQVRDSAQPTKL